MSLKRDVGDRVEQRVEVALDLDLARRRTPGPARACPGAVASRASARGEVIRSATSELSGPGLAAVVADHADRDVRPDDIVEMKSATCIRLTACLIR